MTWARCDKSIISGLHRVSTLFYAENSVAHLSVVSSTSINFPINLARLSYYLEIGPIKIVNKSMRVNISVMMTLKINDINK